MPIAIPKGTHHRTKQEFVYQTLRNAIMRCDLGPGERLVIDDLARRLGVSIIPVREALQMLQSEALVVLVPHVGATVATISKDSIVDVFTMLEGLETVGTRLAAERATPEDHSRLIALVHEMEEVIKQERYEDWADLNTRFHLAIARIPGLAMLEEMTARVLDVLGSRAPLLLQGRARASPRAGAAGASRDAGRHHQPQSARARSAGATPQSGGAAVISRICEQQSP